MYKKTFELDLQLGKKRHLIEFIPSNSFGLFDIPITKFAF